MSYHLLDIYHLAMKTILICNHFNLGTQSGHDAVKDRGVSEVNEDDESAETHRYGFLVDGMSPTLEAYGKVTASVGCPAPPF